MIERQNLLELIGKHRGKYHSCVLTCYSLDFSFFEERVLPVLKTANIKNINVIADGKYLENAQENTSGREFRHNKTYNFQPIYASGVFHPKIMLLTGVKHGLLFIGSGNITSAGLNTNDEIWGAFHLDHIENENAPLFSDVWAYLQPFLNQANGFLIQKFEWIRKYSPWLDQLPINQKPVSLDSLKQIISLVTNSENESIYEQLIKLVPTVKLEELTVISPYYDLKGELLAEMYNYYKPETFNCVIDSEFGLLPKDISRSLKNVITFYNWKDCKADYNEHFNRLHAKIFHFQFTGGVEYMMLGSANATVAAMGINSKRPINSEAGIIISRQAKISLLEELDINLSKEYSVDINSAQTNKSTLLPNEQSREFKARILYSELNAEEITIYLKSKTSMDANVSLFSNISLETEKIGFSFSGEKVTVKCRNPEDVFKICLTDNTGGQISNYSIVHRLDYLLKCNPDPQQEKLDGLLAQDFDGGEGYAELLQYVESNWADEEYQDNKVQAYRNNGKHLKQAEELEREYDKLSAKEFNKISDEVLLRQAGELTSTNVKIADFLQIVSSDLFNKSDDSFRESEEQKLFEDIEQRGEGSEVPPSGRLRQSGQKEKKAVATYFKRLNELYNEKLNIFYNSSALTESPKDEISIKNLSNILIALQLIQLYFGKRFSYEITVRDKDERKTIEDIYLIEGNLYSGSDTVKGFMIDVFGKFLLVATGKFKNYEYEILAQKLKNSKRQVFIKSVFVTLNLSWSDKELDYMNTLLLNILYFLNPDNVSNNEFENDLKSQVEKLKVSARYLSSSFQKNYNYFIDNLMPKYTIWAKTFEDGDSRKMLFYDTEMVEIGQYIFNSRIGFNVVLKNKRNRDKIILSLKRVGYEWVEEQEACVLENVEYSSKCVIYN